MVCDKWSEKAREVGSFALWKLLGAWISRSLLTGGYQSPRPLQHSGDIVETWLSWVATHRRHFRSPSHCPRKTLLVDKVAQITVWKTQSGWPVITAGRKGVYCVALVPESQARCCASWGGSVHLEMGMMLWDLNVCMQTMWAQWFHLASSHSSPSGETAAPKVDSW